MMISPLKVIGIAFLYCLVWVILPAGGTAQEREAPGPPLLTLEDAVKTGLERNPRMAAARFHVDASDARVSRAKSGLYPRIDFTPSFLRTTNPAQAFSIKLNQEEITQRDFDPARLNDPSPTHNFSGELSLTLPVYEAGRVRIGVNQAELGRGSACLYAEQVRQEVIAGVVVAYAGVILMEDQLQVVDQTLETARANGKTIRARYESGLVIKSDLLRAEVRIAELEQERLNACSQAEVARAVLNAAMGVEMDRAYRLSPLHDGGSPPPGDLDRWLRESLERRPDLQQIRTQVTVAEEEVRKTRMAHLPSLYLTGSYEVDTEDFSETVDNYTVGVLLRLNLFGGFETQSKVREALAELQKLRAMRKQAELGVEVETRRAFAQALNAFERIKVADAARGQAEEGLRIVRNRYESGLFTIVNLLDAEAALQQAKTHYIRALHDYMVAMAQLRLASGTMDESSVPSW